MYEPHRVTCWRQGFQRPLQCVWVDLVCCVVTCQLRIGGASRAVRVQKEVPHRNPYQSKESQRSHMSVHPGTVTLAHCVIDHQRGIRGWYLA